MNTLESGHVTVLPPSAALRLICRQKHSTRARITHPAAVVVVPHDSTQSDREAANVRGQGSMLATVRARIPER